MCARHSKVGYEPPRYTQWNEIKSIVVFPEFLIPFSYIFGILTALIYRFRDLYNWVTWMNILALLLSLIFAALGIWQIKDSKSTSLISVMACLSITIAIMSLLAVIFPVNDHVPHDREVLSCDRNLNSVTVKQREIYRDLESNTNDERIFLECEPSPLE